MTAPTTEVHHTYDLGTGPAPAGTRHHGPGCGCGGADCDPPRALERNRFFPRKLMEVRHWQAEQAYHRTALQQVTRLGLGSGVLCGLEVDLLATGEVAISAGIAVDGRGRQIVVPRTVVVDPSRLTDCAGVSSPDPVVDGAVTVWVCYHECGTDLVALPDACGDTRCVPGMVAETFAVAVTAGVTERNGLPDGVCDELFGHPSAAPAGEAGGTDTQTDPRALLDRLVPRGCGCDEGCVPVAVVTLDAKNGDRLDTSVRTVIRSNRELLDLILCLADHVRDCCATTVVAPPRVVGLWPWPDDQGSGWEDLRRSQRLELAFDRDMAEQGLDDPDAWLGVWLLDPEAGARRLPLARSAGALTKVAVPAGGDGAAYGVKLDPAEAGPRSVLVVMARSTQPGPIRAAGTDQLGLDAELAATGLDQGQRDALWKLAAGGGPDGSLTALAGAAAAGIPAWLPTGDGTAGGELHVALVPPRKVLPAPQLLSVWPAGAVMLGPNEPDGAEAWRMFLEQPRIELLVSRALAADALANPDDWLRMWHGTRDGDRLYAVERVGLERGTAEPQADGTVRYRFGLRKIEQQWDPDNFLVQLRSTPPLVGGSPLGEADPQVLLDADVAGTSLDSQTLFTLWSGGPVPNGIPWALQPTDGMTLHDGVEGGLACWGFAVRRP